MSWQSGRDEDEVFNSLSRQERTKYFANLKRSGGRVAAALDATIGKTWFDQDDDPKGHHSRRQGE